MHALLEFLPIAGLLSGYLIGKSINPDEAMYFLSYGAIIGTLLQFAIYKITRKKMTKSVFITGLLLIAFSVITIILKNDFFIKIKPTVFSWGFALFLFSYSYIKKNSILPKIMGEHLSLPHHKWHILNWAWILFNVLIGLVNLLIVQGIQQNYFSNDTWVSFKAALFPITLIFVAAQAVYIYKEIKAQHDTSTN